MKTSSKQSRLIPAMEITEGAGVTVHRTIGTLSMRNYDPFLMLDQISSDNPDEYLAGFPSHPHRGFNTFTYMIDGDMEHKDSMGNTGKLGAGGAQWMKAASGVIHSEMPKQEDGLMRGFQLWVNLPAANKMDVPEYQEYKGDAFPVVETDSALVKILAGHYGETASPIRDSFTEVNFFDVQLQPDARFEYILPKGHNSFLYIFEGTGTTNKLTVHDKTLISLAGDEMTFVADNEGARFLLVTGKPLNESVVQYGPFVMNTREEIDQAMQDFQNNRFIRDRAWVNKRKSEALSQNNKGA